VLGWYDPGYMGYPDDFGGDDSQDAAQNYAVNGDDGHDGASGPVAPGQPDYSDGTDWPPGEPNVYGPVAPAPGPPAARMPYRGPAGDSQQFEAPQAEGAVTLIFKDGRQPEQIHNYVLTQTTLYVGDGRRHEIALDQIDVEATEKVNREAGVDFRLLGAVN
jgi:hypothetical protein